MKKETQKIFNRLHSTHITYSTETKGKKMQRELPVVIGVLSPLAGESAHLPSLRERVFIRDSILKRIIKEKRNTFYGGMRLMP